MTRFAAFRRRSSGQAGKTAITLVNRRKDGLEKAPTTIGPERPPMEPNHWSRLRTLFGQALEVPPEGRTGFLHEACGEETGLRSRLESLLSAYDEASAYFRNLGQGLLGDDSFSAEHASRIRQLFDEVVDLDTASQRRRLDAIGEEDFRLRREVEALVLVYAEAAKPMPDLDGATPSDPNGLVGRRIGHYEVLEKLGGGGMGVVYRAEDTRLHRTVALKFLPPAWSRVASAKERFMREARTASSLDHPNICTIHEIGETEDGHLFIAMSCYAGETVKKKIARGPLQVEIAVSFALQMAHGLTQAHATGIIHRDIKPANVMVTGPVSGLEDCGLVKVLDFGLAKLAGSSQLTRTGATMGTVAYMSPEQGRGEDVDHRTDIWSLGVVLFEMLTGRRPFQGDYDQAILYAVINEDPIPLGSLRPDAPPALEAIIGKCLAKKPNERYDNVEALEQDLRTLTAPAPAVLSKPSSSYQYSLLLKRGLVGIAGLILLLLALVPGLRQATLQGLGFDVLPEQKHLVVVPTINVGDDPANQFFVDGFFHTLTSKLGRLGQFQSSIWVVPAGDVLKYLVTSPRQAAERLGANLVIESFIQRNGDRVRLGLNLIDTRTLRVLDSKEIEEKPEENGALQDKALSRVVAMLNAFLSPEARNALQADGTQNGEANTLYLEGRGYLSRYTEGLQNIEASINLFEEAVKLDTSFALGYSGLGEAYWRRYARTGNVKWTQQALQFSRRAVALRDDLAPVYITMGLIYAGQGRYAAAQEAFGKALSLEPGNVEALRERAKVYARQGQDETAEATYRQAISLKQSYWKSYSSLAGFYLTRGRLDEAIPLLSEARKRAPWNRSVLNNLGVAYWQKEQIPAAIQMFERVLEVAPDYLPANNNLGTAYFYTGQFEKASDRYEKTSALNPYDYLALGMLGDSDVWAGKPEKARAAYRRALTIARNRLAVNPDDPDVLGNIAWYHYQLGTPDSTRLILQRLEAMPRNKVTEVWGIGEMYELLGERDRALVWMKRSLEAGYGRMQARYSPWLRDIRKDPRFQTIMNENQ